MLEFFSAGNESQRVKSIYTFLSILDVPCPPHNNLHLVCVDDSLGDPGSACDDRALIIDKCLHQFPGLYNNSHWSFCLMDVNQCETVLNVLRSNGFINKTIDNGDSVTVVPVAVSTTVRLYTTRSKFNISTALSSSTSKSPTSSTPAHTTEFSIPASSTSKPSTMKTPSSGDQFPPDISYIYPVIGAFLIACEIVMLCIFSCNKKKREQNATSGSLVLQEEVIEPETASPTKAALHPNSVYDEDSVLSEDKTIYKSYINLKYIDDTSAESTPEKVLIRT
ncbi:uncharacterized protein LOC123544871 isoform X2 [Mercenaria mercenaria]|uniref:uncharacterized protein LOC123544871 isoform X2 n=1 Tax=Mercenaria mercenaria TaxID=6596 RepID=UPI00234F5590|nr:uncharacterized protein LOC123544871 isoform X2 [Mercenaria mercenaria]